jgi:hypothetical protein
MALFDDILNGGNLATSLAIGAGALIAELLLSSTARPVAKSVIKRGTDRLSRGRAVLRRRGGSHRRHGPGSPTRNCRDNTGARPCRGEQFALVDDHQLWKFPQRGFPVAEVVLPRSLCATKAKLK